VIGGQGIIIAGRIRKSDHSVKWLLWYFFWYLNHPSFLVVVGQEGTTGCGRTVRTSLQCFLSASERKTILILGISWIYLHFGTHFSRSFIPLEVVYFSKSFQSIFLFFSGSAVHDDGTFGV
jgi:hypothetical protein